MNVELIGTQELVTTISHPALYELEFGSILALVAELSCDEADNSSTFLRIVVFPLTRYYVVFKFDNIVARTRSQVFDRILANMYSVGYDFYDGMHDIMSFATEVGGLTCVSMDHGIFKKHF